MKRKHKDAMIAMGIKISALEHLFKMHGQANMPGNSSSRNPLRQLHLRNQSSRMPQRGIDVRLFQ